MLENIFKTVLIMSLSGSMLCIIFLLLKPITKKMFSPVWHYYIWLFVLFIFILPVRFNMPNLTSISSELQPVNNEVIYKINEDAVFAENTDLKRIDVAYARPESAEFNKKQEVFAQSATILKYLCYVWLLGFIVFFITKFYKYKKFTLLLHKNSNLSEEKFDLPKNLILKETQALDAPLLVGFIKPVLYLTKAENVDLHYVIMHELMHNKRKDILYKWFAFFVSCLHWFNPVVYFICKKIDEDCEISCDYLVAKKLSAESKKEYMNTILTLLEKTLSPRPLTTQMASSKKLIKERFRAITTSSVKNKKMIFLSLALSVFLLLTTLFVSGVLQKKTVNLHQNRILNINTDLSIGDKNNILVCGVDNSGRADMIMIMSTDSEILRIVSVPRKSAFSINNEVKTASEIFSEENGFQKIINAIRENFMIPINYYAKIDLTSAEKIVDILGGVEVEIPFDMNYSDPYQNLEINFKKGKQILNGENALNYLRYRKGYTEGELQRDEAQLQFVQNLILQKNNAENLKKLPEIYQVISEKVQTNLSFDIAKKLIKQITDINAENILIYHLPGENVLLDDNTLVFQIDYLKSVNTVFDNMGNNFGVTSNENAEKLTGSDIKKLQADVDNGHYPWRLNPEETAKEYMKNQGFAEGEITALAGSGAKCSVTFSSNGLSHIIDLYKPAKQNDEGIWVVKMAETLIEDFVFTTEEVESAKEVVYEYYKQLAKRNREGILKTMTPWHDMPNAVFWQNEKITLKNLHYSVNDPMRLSYVKNGRGSVSGAEYQNVIVLKADIEVTYNEGEKSAWSQGEYGWNLILIRDGKNGKWLIDDMGW